MQKFRYLEDVALADIAFEAYGKDLNELFENSALATFEVMVKTSKLKPKLKKEFSLETKKLEDLLFDYLAELVYIKDVDQLVFCKFNAEVKEEKGMWKVKAVAEGEKIDYGKQDLMLDVKAITLHMFKIEKTKEGYKASVLLDI